MKNIYIDFDGTLFDTNSFYNDFIGICHDYNVSNSDIELNKEKIEGPFNLDVLADMIKDIYNLDDIFIKRVTSLYSDKYLYYDSLNFLEKYKDKYILNILTYGDYSYQSKKINCCNIKRYFKNIIITDNKGNESIDYNNSIFIDNNPNDIDLIYKKKPFKIIRIKRDDDPYKGRSSLNKVDEFFDLSTIDML